MAENQEKSGAFKEQIASQIEALDLSSDVFDAQSLEVGRVSEIVGENASENLRRSKKPKKTGLKIISQQVAGLLSGGGTKSAQAKALPTPIVQKRKVKKALEKRTRKLVKEATKLQKSKHFSADRLEEIILEIRHLKEILADLYHITIERVEELYRRFVLGAK